MKDPANQTPRARRSFTPEFEAEIVEPWQREDVEILKRVTAFFASKATR